MTDAEAIKMAEEIGYTDVWVISRPDEAKGIMALNSSGKRILFASKSCNLQDCLAMMDTMPQTYAITVGEHG